MEKRTFTKEDLSIALSRSGVEAAPIAMAEPKLFRADIPNASHEVEQLKSIIKALGAKVHALIEEKNTVEKDAQASISVFEKSIQEKDTILKARDSEIKSLKEELQILEKKAAAISKIEAPKIETPKPVPVPILQPRQDPTNTQAYLKVVFEKQQIEDEISSLRCEKIATFRRMQDLIQENGNLKKDLETLQTRTISLDQELSELTQKQQALQSETEQLRIELSAQKQHTAQLTFDLKEKELQLNSEQAKSQDNGSRIQSLEAKVFELSDELSVSQQKENVSSSNARENEDKLNLLREEAEQLQDAFRKKIEEVASLHELLAIRTQELDSTQTQLENQTQALQDQKKGNALLLEEHQSLQIKLKEALEEFLKTKEALKDVEREATRMKAALSKLHLAERLSIQLNELFKPQESEIHNRQAYEPTSFFEGSSYERPGSLF